MALLRYILLVLIISAFSACHTISVDDCSTYDFSDCQTRKPDSALVSVTFSSSKMTPEIYIELFRGKTDHGEKIDSGYFSEGFTEFLLPVDQEYSAKAYYFKGKDTIITIDGCYLNRDYVKVCDSVCWEVNNPVLKLKLK
ncbi:MAG: hypothetical protein GX437_00025 [Sphingobacteriales bacterium]|nr:hypothetical protein [Sphingobacteriales bacterium]